jgi:hypothetical protein
MGLFIQGGPDHEPMTFAIRSRAYTRRARNFPYSSNPVDHKVMTGELAPARHIPDAATLAGNQDPIGNMMYRR